MFDIGGWEFLIIVMLAIVVIGPKDLPATVRTVTLWLRKARGFAREFQSGLDDIAREVEIDDVKRQITDGLDEDGLTDDIRAMQADIEDAMAPADELGEAFGEAESFVRDPLADDGESAGSGGADENRIAPPEAADAAATPAADDDAGGGDEAAPDKAAAGARGGAGS